MTAIEAAELLALMRGTWPRLAPDEIADRLWLEDLMGCDRRAGLEAFRTLRASRDHVPSWAVFAEACQMHTRRLAPPTRELEAPSVVPSEAERQRVHELVAGLKT